MDKDAAVLEPQAVAEEMSSPQYNGYGNNSYGGGYGQSNPYDNRDASFDTRHDAPPPSYGMLPYLPVRLPY